MKITNVRTVVVNAQMRNWVFVKVETDEPGLFGWGEASLEWKTRAVVGAVEDFKPMLVGEDPTRIEHLYQRLHRGSFCRTGMGLIGMSAISGIEMACWDILGKSVGLPAYRLLGGAVRERVRMYTISATERTPHHPPNSPQLSAAAADANRIVGSSSQPCSRP